MLELPPGWYTVRFQFRGKPFITEISKQTSSQDLINRVCNKFLIDGAAILHCNDELIDLNPNNIINCMLRQRFYFSGPFIFVILGIFIYVKVFVCYFNCYCSVRFLLCFKISLVLNVNLRTVSSLFGSW